jgi:hypothetical protein
MKANRFKYSTHSPELLAARDAVMQDIADDASTAEQWQAFSVEWARRMVESAHAHKVAHDLAVRACREARSDDIHNGHLPGWFMPRLKRLLPGYWVHSLINVSQYFGWIDHPTITRVKLPSGERINCPVCEPYPWFAASWYKDPEHVAPENSALTRWPSIVTGDFADKVPADNKHTESMVYFAWATGCKLVIDRITWWQPACIRLTFLPLDHKMKIKEFMDKHNPKPLEWCSKTREMRVVIADCTLYEEQKVISISEMLEHVTSTAAHAQ